MSPTTTSCLHTPVKPVTHLAALLCCCQLAGHLEAARLLLAAGANPHKQCEGSPPLHVAVCAGGQPGREEFAAAAVKLLLEQGAIPYDRHWLAMPSYDGPAARGFAASQPASFLRLGPIAAAWAAAEACPT